MYPIVYKEKLTEQIFRMDIEAPKIAQKAQPGQFIIFRIDETGERVPLTVADTDLEKGTVTIIFQAVGKTTDQLSRMNVGDALLDFVGPLGVATELSGYQNVAVVDGGLGTAIGYPVAKKLHQNGAKVHSIMGFRNKDLIILSDEMAAVSDETVVITDDGSNGRQGFVTDALREMLERGEKFDLVMTIGPLPMMRAVAELTRPFGIKTMVSMSPIMIDGTGMCGGCRLTVGGETKFACVDGPDFDGHLVDFDEAIARQRAYQNEEQASMKEHQCRMGRL